MVSGVGGPGANKDDLIQKRDQALLAAHSHCLDLFMEISEAMRRSDEMGDDVLASELRRVRIEVRTAFKVVTDMVTWIKQHPDKQL